jgi:hypothetical protein
MSKTEEYRANAVDCERMARKANDPGEKATWLQMAQHWLRMIPQPEPSKAEAFDTQEKAEGTHQAPSDSEH